MELKRISRTAGAAILALGMIASTGSAMAQPVAAKKLTCYKGTAVKVVTTAKCPAGWSTKKPAASAKSVALNATYKGKMTMVWTESGVKVNDLSGTSSDAGASGFKTLTATGGSAPQATCAAVTGNFTLAAADGKLNFKVDSSTKGCASNEAAPSPVSVSGSGTITGGTGKYVGATGTLTFKGGFNVKSTAAGTNDAEDFNVTFTGSVKLK